MYAYTPTRFLVLVAVAMLTTVCGVFAYELCFTDSYFGGYIPFILLTFAPIPAYILGGA